MSGAQHHFEHLYQAHGDPWRVASDWYERRKRDVLLACLPREHYRHGFEPGCGNGVSTLRLLDRCERLCAADFSAAAVQLCAQRLEAAQIDRARIELLQLELPLAWPRVPNQGFDLLVVSELAYYLDDASLQQFIERCVDSLAEAGHLLMCHWRGSANDRRQSTEDLHAQVGRQPCLQALLRHEEAEFQLDVWEKFTPKGCG